MASNLRMLILFAQHSHSLGPTTQESTRIDATGRRSCSSIMELSSSRASCPLALLDDGQPTKLLLPYYSS
jgi:hypothetical protein